MQRPVTFAFIVSISLAGLVFADTPKDAKTPHEETHESADAKEAHDHGEAEQDHQKAKHDHQDRPYTGSTVTGDYAELRWNANQSDLPRELLPQLGGRGVARGAGVVRESNRSHALMTWHITEGKWHGIELDGFTVGLVLVSDVLLEESAAADAARDRARADKRNPFTTTLLVDRRADKRQREALVALLSELAPKPLESVRKTIHLDMTFKRRPHEHGDEEAHAAGKDEVDLRSNVKTAPPPEAKLQLSKYFAIELSSLSHYHEHIDGHGGLCSQICGRSARVTAPLSKVVETERAFSHGPVKVPGVGVRALPRGFRGAPHARHVALGGFEF
ncbi:MAG: DUF1326 domain-containing protein [Planctomycetota bacterium]